MGHEPTRKTVNPDGTLLPTVDVASRAMGDPQPADETGIDARTSDGVVSGSSAGSFDKPVTVKLMGDTIDRIEESIEAGEFANLSDAIRWAIRREFKPDRDDEESR